MGLPDFSDPYSEEDYVGNQSTHYQEHFASQIVLRRLYVEFNRTLNNGKPLPRVNVRLILEES